MFRDLSQTKIGMGSKIREMKLNTQYSVRCGYLSKPKYVKVRGKQVEKKKEVHISGKGI